MKVTELILTTARSNCSSSVRGHDADIVDFSINAQLDNF